MYTKRNICFLFLLAIVIHSCQSNCTWKTVEQLDKADLAVCKADSMYYYVRKFSGGFDSIRKAAGVPELPKDFHAVVWTVNNQVRWVNEKVLNKIKDDSTYRTSFLQRKDLEWEKNTLRYDNSNYRSMNELDAWLCISYYLDTIKQSGQYLYRYSYSDKTTLAGEDILLTRNQSDSILKSWGL